MRTCLLPGNGRGKAEHAKEYGTQHRMNCSVWLSLMGMLQQAAGTGKRAYAKISVIVHRALSRQGGSEAAALLAAACGGELQCADGQVVDLAQAAAGKEGAAAPATPENAERQLVVRHNHSWSQLPLMDHCAVASSG